MALKEYLAPNLILYSKLNSIIITANNDSPLIVIFYFYDSQLFLITFIARNLSWKDTNILIFFILMYVQNASMCITELQFIARCLGLYQKLLSINEEMNTFKLRTIVMNRYPLVLRPDDNLRRHDRVGNRDNRVRSETAAAADDKFTRSRVRASISKSVEILKMRHQFVGGTAISDLNDLYSFQLGVSLSVLFAMTLFDIYEVVLFKDKFIKSKSYILFYGWMLQYTFRFCVIVLTAHATTKQVRKSTAVDNVKQTGFISHKSFEYRFFLF